jgi:hypothetical protein
LLLLLAQKPPKPVCFYQQNHNFKLHNAHK